MHNRKLYVTWNGTMFVDIDWPLNASSLLSASAELLVLPKTHKIVLYIHWNRLTSKIQLYIHCHANVAQDVMYRLYALILNALSHFLMTSYIITQCNWTVMHRRRYVHCVGLSFLKHDFDTLTYILAWVTHSCSHHYCQVRWRKDTSSKSEFLFSRHAFVCAGAFFASTWRWRDSACRPSRCCMRNL